MTPATRDLSIAVPGGEIFAREWRPRVAAGLPIILLHDSLGSVELWRDFPTALATATGRTVIAYDRLGYGRSSPRRDAVDSLFIHHEAHIFLPAVVAAFGLTRYVLFGHSVGGGMVLTAAAAHRDACAAVITEAAQAYIEERTRAGIRAAEKNFQDAAQFTKLERWHGQQAQWVLDAWTRVWLSAAFRDWTLDTVLLDVHCPVLAIHGELDEFGSTAFPHHIATGVSGPSQVALIADCGHVPHRQEQAQVLAAVQAFLQDYTVP